jgi:DNA polymerase I
MGRKILLLDGNSLTYRAFYALPTDMATASGQVTNAVYGFTAMLQYLMNEHKPDAVAVTFDRPEPTFRHEMVKDYKAGRQETPDILRQQMGLVRQVVETLGLPLFEKVGFEADDVIATLATQGKANGDDIIIVTGDRDSYQLVDDAKAPDDGSIRVLYNKRGVSDYALYDEAGILERTGVTPAMYPQYASLRGDPSDNLPGVPGVGEKTAAKLINDYGGLEGIFANIAKCTPKLRANLAEAQAQVMSNFAATPLIRDVPDVSLDLVGLPAVNMAAARELFKTLEIRNVADRLLIAMDVMSGGVFGGAAEEEVLEGERLEVLVLPLNEGAFTELLAAGSVAIAGSWAGIEGRSALEGMVFAIPEGGTWWLPSSQLSEPDTNQFLRNLLSQTPPTVHAHRAKELIRALNDAGLEVDPGAGFVGSGTESPVGDGLDIDTAVAGYLLDPAESNYALAELALKHAQIDIRPMGAAPSGQLDFDGAQEDPIDQVAREALAIARMAEPMRKALEARGLSSLYEDVERPLIGVLTRMEVYGVRVDTTYLKELSQSLTAQARELEEEVQTLAGEKFVVNSVPQLRTVLFDKLGLKTDKKTKTGYSTDAQALEKIRDDHPIIPVLLKYRELEKLRSTYGESLLTEVASDGRIHASFNQTVARTGRLSSDRPNLHNIPIRSEEGRQFRRAFIPGDNQEFLVADYNQIELRVIAHLAADPGLVEAFTTGADVHTETAKRIFAVDTGDVTLAMRSKAKMVSYGLAYGMESYGLAQRLGIPVKEASTILDAYFVAFPNVRAYMDAAVAEARNKGYTETLFGRRRLIPDLQNPNYSRRMAAERQAMNAGIQGLAADIFKVALVQLDRALVSGGYKSKLILQVHDEVILEVPPEEKEVVGPLTIDILRNAAKLDVPLEVNVAWGNNWGEAKA